MHILWLIPDYCTFLREEMIAIAPRVDRLSVLTQAAPKVLPGISVQTIPADRMNISRVVARGVEASRAIGACGLPRRSGDLPRLRRIARHNEVMRDFVNREKVDIIHSHFGVPEGTFGWQASCGRPIVATFRGVDILSLPRLGYGFMNDPLYAKNLKRGLKHVAAVTVASRRTLEAAKSAGADVRKLHLIRNGVDLDRFSDGSPERIQAAREAVGAGERKMILGAGNLVPGKAFDCLIQAFARVRTPDHLLVIAGDGAEMSNLRGIVDTAHLNDSVVVTGRVDRDRMAGLFHACDLFVHPSLSEGFGNVVVEAMVAGKPVIATRTGVAADIFDDHVNGILVAPGDIDELAAAMDHVLRHPDAASAMAAAGREYVARELSLEKRTEAFVQLYRDIAVQRCVSATGQVAS